MTERDRWLRRVEAYYAKMTGLDAVVAQLKDLGDMLREDGAIGLVVYNPVKLTVGDPASYEKYAGFVVATARGAGMEAMDMTPIYEAYLRRQGRRKMEEALWVSARDWHPNAVAHGLIAGAVMDLLGKRMSQLGGSGNRPAAERPQWVRGQPEPVVVLGLADPAKPPARLDARAALRLP